MWPPVTAGGRTQAGMTEQNQNRKSDGKYTYASHAPSAVTVGAPARRPELAGWPESLPEPEVDITFGDDNVVSTTVSINGESVFEVWNPADDIHSTETTSFVSRHTDDEGIHDEAETWAKEKHNEIADSVRAETAAAVRRTRAGILAKATGKAPEPASDEDLAQAIDDGYTVANSARRDAEYAASALLSRGILAEHPDAYAIGLVVSGADNGEYVSGAVVYNEDREQIGYYDEEDTHTSEGDGRPARPFLKHLNDLTPIAGNSYWAAFNVSRPRHQDDQYTIELKRAAAWAPGAEA